MFLKHADGCSEHSGGEGTCFHPQLTRTFALSNFSIHPEDFNNNIFTFLLKLNSFDWRTDLSKLYLIGLSLTAGSLGHIVPAAVKIAKRNLKSSFKYSECLNTAV